MKKTDFEEIPVNEGLLNIITPTGIEFKRNGVIAGEVEGKVYGVIQYPNEVDVGWLSKITNSNETIVDITLTPTDNSALIESLSRNVSQNRGTAESTRSPLERQRALKKAENGEETMKRVDQDGEIVVYCSITAMPIAKRENILTNICRRFESFMTALRCRIRGLANLQKEAYQSISPYHVPNEKIEKMTKTIMPLSSILGGLPFSSSSYSDGKGFYFGKDSGGSMIAIDPWIRGGDRTNSNWVIMGVAGQGKSAAAKHIITAEFSKGTKVIIIDPEREVRQEVA